MAGKEFIFSMSKQDANVKLGKLFYVSEVLNK
jgi:hypothetical protein